MYKNTFGNSRTEEILGELTEKCSDEKLKKYIGSSLTKLNYALNRIVVIEGDRQTAYYLFHLLKDSYHKKIPQLKHLNNKGNEKILSYYKGTVNLYLRRFLKHILKQKQ